MELTELPGWLESLGVVGLLAVGIYGFVSTKVMSKKTHDEIVTIYREGAATDEATIKQLTSDVTRLTATMDKIVTSQQETLESVRMLLPMVNASNRRPE